MSSRALRKLQREQEQQKLLQQVEDARRTQEECDDDDEEDEEDVKASEPKNAFDMLEDLDEDESDPELVDAAVSTEPSEPVRQDPTSSKTSKSKKKKKKSKKKSKETAPVLPQLKEDSSDEIDRALKEISAKGHGEQLEQHVALESNWEASATKLLAIDTKNLNAMNEMRSLFGNVALEGQQSRASPRNPRRREQNQQGGVDLATGLTGRYNVASGGKELGYLAHRRNVFVQGKEEWPLTASGGLSMEHIPDSSSFERRYNIMHNNAYQETQMQFRMIVESMDPQRMIALLTLSPYHIATLLQVSEIAKHQGDHSVSGDLLERALFSLGRSVHSSFPMAMREGTARLPFENAANRDLYLAIWRYIRSLEMRGTWKTAFEWAKLLLQLNTTSDPYGVTLMIDQLALRGRSHDQLLQLASDEAYGNAWRHLPNIQISRVLAYMRAKQPREARKQLALAIHHYPYIISALASALEISPLPKALWAKLPETDAEKLYTELYILRAKDLWNMPETLALIPEVAETLSYYESTTSASPPPPKLEISLEEARHVVLLETPSLIALLPRRFTAMRTSAFDVLPPPSGSSDLTLRRPMGTDATGASAIQTIFNAAGAAAGSTGSAFQRIINWFHAPAGPSDADAASPNEGEAAFQELQAQLSRDVPPEMIEQLLQMHMDGANQEVEDQEVEDHNQITAEGMGMTSGWDYYADAAAASSAEDDDDDESVPDLQDIPTRETRPTAAPTPPMQPRNPHAATVEEDEDEMQGELEGIGQSDHLGAVLRHVDSDSEGEADSDGIAAHPRRPTHILFTDPDVALGANMRRPTPAAPVEPDVEADPQRLQRWLLTTGLTELQADSSKIGLYVRRLKMLRKPQQDWILNMAGQRGGDAKGTADRVRRELGS